MAVTTKQIGRYRVIDECLQNGFHTPSTSSNPEHRGVWSLDDLKDAIEEKLDLEKPVSDRTMKEDIHRMKEDADLAYYAPIENIRGVGYYYDDKDYKLTEQPLKPADIEALKDVVEFLHQFKGFRYFADAEGLIHNIEENITKSEFIDVEFDILPDYRGLEYIEPLKKAMKDKVVLKMTYRSFSDDAEVPRHIHPYMLKQYNNRWFVYAFTEEYKDTNRTEGIYGLERIISLEKSSKKYRKPNVKRIKNYFKNIIGVTNFEDSDVVNIVIRMKKHRANYLRTKPVHSSQKVTKESLEYDWFSFKLKPNPEFRALLLGYGQDVVVEEPASLAIEMKEILREAAEQYSE
jgi:predicted DNA-binding transcriptional regulator YafY